MTFENEDKCRVVLGLSLLTVLIICVLDVIVLQYFRRKRLFDNKGLVSSLRDNGTITTSRVADVMEQIDRGLFVPAGEGDPYMDHPVPIGYNATISAPHMHAACLALLNDHLQPGMRALDIGSGLITFVYLFRFCESSLNVRSMTFSSFLFCFVIR